MPTKASDFAQLEKILERVNRRNRPGRIFRDSIRQNDRLSELRRSSPFGRAAVDTISLLGSALSDELFSTQQGIPRGGSNGGIIFSDGVGNSDNTASGLGSIFSQDKIQFGLANIFTNLFEGAIQQAFSKTKTRTTASESARSIDTQSRWKLSRSQQDATLASVVNRGLSQL